MMARMSTVRVRLASAPNARRASPARAMTPPSPSLSARMTIVTYLTETISVTDQNTIEMTP